MTEIVQIQEMWTPNSETFLTGYSKNPYIRTQKLRTLRHHLNI